MREKQLRELLKKLRVSIDREEDDWLICTCCFTWKHAQGHDNTPSLGIKIEPEGRSGYHCWSCHSKGSLPNLLFQLAKHREDPALTKLGHKVEMDEILGSDELEFEEWGSNGKNSTKEKSRVSVTFPDERALYDKYPSAFTSTRAIEYLVRRGIHVDTIEQIGIRYDEYQQRVLLPVSDYWTGRFAGFTGRIILSDRRRSLLADELSARYGKRITVPKIRDYGGLTKRSLLLGRFGSPISYKRVWGRVRGRNRPEANYVILVEGLFAYLRLTQLGFENVYAILGSVLTPEKANILRDMGKAVYWFVDNDLAGQQCLYGSFNHEEQIFEGGGALDQLYKEVMQYTVEWPEGKDDPDDLTLDEVNYMVENGEPFLK